MPFWDRDLDLVVLTHPDTDHMAAQAEAAGAQVQVQSAGGWADLGDGVALWVLSPPPQGFGGENEDNENSLVAKLVYVRLVPSHYD
jgi:beta-lactamase superfamily II metal-dependent hydrolase